MLCAKFHMITLQTRIKNTDPYCVVMNECMQQQLTIVAFDLTSCTCCSWGTSLKLTRADFVCICCFCNTENICCCVVCLNSITLCYIIILFLTGSELQCHTVHIHNKPSNKITIKSFSC